MARGRRADQVLRLLANHGSQTARQLADRLGEHPHHVLGTLKNLERSRTVKRAGLHRDVRVYGDAKSRVLWRHASYDE